jgi:uncharacterized membrane protein
MSSESSVGLDRSLQRSTRRNIEAILKLEKNDQQQLSPLHRVSHAIGWFVGTIYFILLQCVIVAGWVVANTIALRTSSCFDPYPFPLLSTVLALEAVLLTSFVLIRQNAIDLQSERRNHLDLQINLLAEEEATTILNLLHSIAQELKIDMTIDAHSKELAKDTAVESIAQDLRARER